MVAVGVVFRRAAQADFHVDGADMVLARVGDGAILRGDAGRDASSTA